MPYEKPLLSIIVPVYKVENYLQKCIDSILAQTFTDFELILVDDGSKDRSGQICDEYAEMDERVKVIHKENSGPSDTRNRGIEQAAGNYFMFVDSDDYIAPTMVECLYQSILKENADIAACNFLYSFEDDRNQDFSTNIQWEVVSGAEIFYNRKNDRSCGYWTVVWNKLYKSKVFGKLRFRAGKYYEDEFWANDIYQMDIKMVTIPECLYYYRQHGNNSMKTTNSKKNLDILEALQDRIDIYLMDETHAAQAYRVLIYSLEYLEKSKRMITNREEKAKYLQAEKRTKDIVHQLRKRKLTNIQRTSLVFLELAPCLVFAVGMKFRGLLERFI